MQHSDQSFRLAQSSPQRGLGPSEHAVPGGPRVPVTAPLYLELGHIRGWSRPHGRAVLQAPGLVILAGAPFVEIGRTPGPRFQCALVSVKLRQAAGEVFEGAAVVVADDREVDLSASRLGRGADSDAGALPLNGQVVVLQEHGVPLLVLVLVSRVTLWGPGPWWFDFLSGPPPALLLSMTR